MPTDSASSKPLSWVSVAAILAGFALFILLGYLARRPDGPVPVDLSQVAEGDRWKFTAEGRAQRLADLRAREISAAQECAWIDRSKGVVRLPIDLAMEITVKEIAASRR
ncbi:MAG: hypothetical protein HZA31_02850 [Opitutae bacterium]|nr:hypothetical protein [Opitutae bacterium]